MWAPEARLEPMPQRVVVTIEGRARAAFILRTLLDRASAQRVSLPPIVNTPYWNTIGPEEQQPFPGDLAMEERISAVVRWNALAMVARANRESSELGGHIATYASIADLFEVGFNHFFRAASPDLRDLPAGARSGDLVFFQPHAAPGVYARAFMEGRLTEEQLGNFRRETSAPVADATGLDHARGGLSSYCHPWLMPHFWQFPTGSMGLGPIQAIYQARFLRYLEAERKASLLYRALAETVDGERREALLELADIEDEHAEHWVAKLQENGVEVPPAPTRLDPSDAALVARARVARHEREAVDLACEARHGRGHTGETLAAAIQNLYKQNQSPLKGLVLDLRNGIADIFESRPFPASCGRGGARSGIATGDLRPALNQVARHHARCE